MTLTTGTTLQDGKYLIQAVLHQDDWGTTYQAVHTPLDQPVVVQTVHPDQRRGTTKPSGSEDCPQDSGATPRVTTAAMTDHQQQLMEEVRRRFKAQLPATVPIVDCFWEDNAPYVVLSLPQGTTPPVLGDWFAATTMPPAIAQPAFPTTPTPTDAAPPPPVAPVPLEGTTVVAMPLNVRTYQKDQPYLQGRSRTQRWLPVGLLVTALVAGMGGATLGWAVRTDRIVQLGQATLLEPLLNNEQSFPPVEGWPVDEPGHSGFSFPSERSAGLTPYGSGRDEQRTGQDYFPEPLPEWDSPPPARRREAARPEYTAPIPDLPVAEPAPPVDVPTADPPTAEVPVEPPNPPAKLKPAAPEQPIPAAPPAIAPPPPAPEAPPAPAPVVPPPVTP